MRRTLYLLAAMLAGAVPTASAQVRPITLAARLDRAANNPTGLVVRVSGLLDDLEWQDYLLKSYTIQLHWTVQLWKKGGLLGGSAQPKTEWDVEVQAVPLLSSYAYTERVTNDHRVFETLDSLKTLLGAERTLRGPAPLRLSAGDWYYTVSVDITALTQEQVDRRANGGGVDLGEMVRGLFSPGGRVSLNHPRIEFTVPGK